MSRKNEKYKKLLASAIRKITFGKGRNARAYLRPDEYLALINDKWITQTTPSEMHDATFRVQRGYCWSRWYSFQVPANKLEQNKH